MKKKLSAALVCAIALTLAAVTALAAIAVMYSDNAGKISLAREALYQKYGLTPKTLGMFIHEGKEENGVYTLAWTCDTFHPKLVGVYTTVVRDGKAEASWSYDDVDAAVYASGALSAPVWGQKQLEAAFDNKEEADRYSLALYDQYGHAYDTPIVRPDSLQAGERYWQGEVYREAEPNENSLPQEKAYEIAVQALCETFGLERETVTAGKVTGETFCARENGGTLWDIAIFIALDGAECDCVVRLDGQTGEVLSVDALTGGNG